MRDPSTTDLLHCRAQWNWVSGSYCCYSGQGTVPIGWVPLLLRADLGCIHSSFGSVADLFRPGLLDRCNLEMIYSHLEFKIKEEFKNYNLTHIEVLYLIKPMFQQIG